MADNLPEFSDSLFTLNGGENETTDILPIMLF